MESFLSILYNQIKFRTKSATRPKSHIYFGLEIMTKETFMKYLKDSQFLKLYADWILCGKQRKKVPTLDRIDGRRGYTKDNVQWVTLSQNSSRVDFSYRAKRCLPGVKKEGNWWLARIREGHKHVVIGKYSTEQEAHLAYLDRKKTKVTNKENSV